MLSVRRLGKQFDGRWIFRDLSFDLEPGQALAALGPNGSGKSSLLKVIAGLWSPSEGSVIRPPGDLRTTLGYSGLDLAVYSNLTGREHLDWAGRSRQVEARTEELLGKVGLSRAGGQLVSQYSSGMRARLKLALAIQARPRVLLLDEPSASLDERGRELVRELIEAQLAGDGAVVLATNDPEEREWATHELVFVG